MTSYSLSRRISDAWETRRRIKESDPNTGGHVPLTNTLPNHVVFNGTLRQQYKHFYLDFIQLESRMTGWLFCGQLPLASLLWHMTHRVPTSAGLDTDEGVAISLEQ
jgi:hypothetical protein